MKKLLLLLLIVAIPTMPVPFMDSCHILWQKTKECLHSKPGKMTCCIVGSIAAVLVVRYGVKYIRLTKLKKYAFLMGDTWQVDLPTIYTHFPILKDTLEVRPQQDVFTVVICVQKQYQDNLQVLAAFYSLKKAYQDTARYNSLRKKGIQFFAVDPGGISLTIFKV